MTLERRYNIASLVGFSALALLLGWLLTASARQNLLELARDQTAAMVTSLAASRLTEADLAEPALEADRYADLGRRLDDLLHAGQFFRVKVYRADGTVVWSDEPNLVGRQFPTGEGFLAALAGLPHVELSRPDAEENVYERDYRHYMEMYVPVRRADGGPLGVMEFYTSLDALDHSLRSRQWIIWGLLFTGALGLHLALNAEIRRAGRIIRRQTGELERSRRDTIRALARAIDARDPCTNGHSERVAHLALLLGRRLRLPDADLQILEESAVLHDVGKIGVPDAVLGKPGPLTLEEYNTIKQHPVIGWEILRDVGQLDPRILEGVRHHHERMDGRGYPDGLKGMGIPRLARILAVADSYDAMRSVRPYRRALTRQEAGAELRRGAGTQFDPTLVDLFLGAQDEAESAYTAGAHAAAL